MKKVALISGITGQDGSFLAEFLIEKGYEVHGILRRSSSFNTGRIEHLYLDEWVRDMQKYNPQIQISVVSGTKRSIFRQKNKAKRSKKRLHTTLIKPEQKVNEDLCSGFIVS